MTTEKNTYHPLGEKAWLTQLQKGAGMRTHQVGRGFGSLLRSAIPIVKQQIRLNKKKATTNKKKHSQKGRGFAVRPLRQMQRAVGPIRVQKARKSIKRNATMKKRKTATVSRKKKKKKKRDNTFGLF